MPYSTSCRSTIPHQKYRFSLKMKGESGNNGRNDDENLAHLFWSPVPLQADQFGALKKFASKQMPYSTSCRSTIPHQKSRFSLKMKGESGNNGRNDDENLA